MKYIVNSILSLVLIVFLYISFNIYINNNHISSSSFQKNVFLFQIEIISKSGEYSERLGSLIDPILLGSMLTSKLGGKGLVFDTLSSNISKYNNLYLYDISLVIEVDSNFSSEFEKNFKEKERNIYKSLEKILDRKSDTLEKIEKESEYQIISKDEIRRFHNNEDLNYYLEFRQCNKYILSQDISLVTSVKDGQNDFGVSFLFQCVDTLSDGKMYNMNIDLIPYYEMDIDRQSFNSLYIIYVFITFFSGLILIYLNYNFLRKNLSNKSIK